MCIRDSSYGAPVLPGAMFLLSYYREEIPIVGLPGCVMYAKRTIFDLALPRRLADDEITAEELAALGEGGLCPVSYTHLDVYKRQLRDTAYKAIYARENYLKNNLREPTIMEIASEIGMEKEEIVYALDAIQSPMSLYEPVYTCLLYTSRCV